MTESMFLGSAGQKSGKLQGLAAYLENWEERQMATVLIEQNSDSTAPEVVSLNLTASSVEAGSGEGRIGAQIQISDDSSGFRDGAIFFGSPSGNSSTYVSLYDPSNLVSGTELAGT